MRNRKQYFDATGAANVVGIESSVERPWTIVLRGQSVDFRRWLYVGWPRLDGNGTPLQDTPSAERDDLVATVRDAIWEIKNGGAMEATVLNLCASGTHQFRRTFAVFVARNMLGDVRYLRHHFKHWSIDMTLYYASDPLFDDSLLETTLTTRDELQATVLSDWLTGEKPLTGGRSGHILQFRQRDKPKTVTGPSEIAKSLGDGVFIRGTGHSWCLATNAGCGGEGLYDAIRCVNCRESVIDQRHIGIWREIRRQQIETLSWPDLGQPIVKRALDHIQAAEQVLVDLGERVEPYQSEGAGDAGKD